MLNLFIASLAVSMGLTQPLTVEVGTCTAINTAVQIDSHNGYGWNVENVNCKNFTIGNDYYITYMVNDVNDMYDDEILHIMEKR